MVSIMMRLLFFLSLFTSIAYAIDSGKLRENLFMNGPCRLNQYRCMNDICINRRLYCNGFDDCGDNSDEKYCNKDGTCTNLPKYVDCTRSDYYDRRKCIPSAWKCDGVLDCPYNNDENDCDNYKDLFLTSTQISRVKNKAWKWMISKRDNQSLTLKWGSNIPRIAIALYLCNPDFMEQGNFTDEIMYELNLNLLSRLALKKMEDISTSELALYVNSFLLNCINPRKFYGVDLVKELRKRIDSRNITNPAALLALCNAQELMTETDIMKLTNSCWEASAKFRIDTQAIIIMALACAQKQNMIDQKDLTEMIMDLKKKQYRNGTVESIKTTALVMQALFASEVEADEEHFDERKALEQIIRLQEEDGSFGNFLNTYYVLPVLNYLSFVNISSDHCSSASKDENEGLQYLKNQAGDKWNVKFSLWIGEGKVLRRSIELSVPVNTSFYGIMEYASDLDDKYKFQYIVRNRKPYVFGLSGILDDAEMETFWLPYFLSNELTEELKPIEKSVADVYPKHNDHLVFWYKKDT